jgi:hypothetical protein
MTSRNITSSKDLVTNKSLHDKDILCGVDKLENPRSLIFHFKAIFPGEKFNLMLQHFSLSLTSITRSRTAAELLLLGIHEAVYEKSVPTGSTSSLKCCIMFNSSEISTILVYQLLV